MKRLLTILTIVVLAWPTFGQDYTHERATTSRGGGASTGGDLENFAIVGEPVVGQYFKDDLTGTVGMLLEEASPTGYFWVGDGGSWEDLAHWATSSGGSEFHTVLPTIDDDVYFDGNSFTIPGQIVTVADNGDDQGVQFRNMDWRGVQHNPTFQIRKVTSQWLTSNSSGSLHFDDNMVLDFDWAEFTFQGDNYVIDTRGHDLGTGNWMAINYNPGGGESPGNAVLISDLNGDFVYIDGGSFSTQGHNITAPGYFWITGNYSQNVDLGSSSITTNSWTIASPQTGGSNLQLNGSIVNVTGLFKGGNQSYNEVIFGAGPSTLNGNNYFETLSFLPGADIQLQDGTTQNFDNLIANGTQVNTISIHSETEGIQAGFSKNDGSVEGHWLILKDNDASGGATFNAYNSTDDGNVTGWNFQGFTQDYYWIGDGGQWADLSHWSSSSGGTADKVTLPTIVDNVYFDANSFTTTGQVVEIPDNGDAKGVVFRDMDWTGVLHDPTFRIVKDTSPWITSECGGSLTFDDNMTLDFLGAEFVFRSQEDYFVDTKGKYLGDGSWMAFNVTFLEGLNPTNGTAYLASDLMGDFVYFGGGVFHSNDFEINAPGHFNIWRTFQKELYFGSSILTTNSFHAGDQHEGTIIDMGTSTLNLAGSFNGGGYEYNDVNILEGITSFSGSSSFNNLVFEPGVEVELEAGSTQTTNNLVVTGTSDKIITFTSSEEGEQADFWQTQGTVNGDWLSLKDNNAGGTIFTATNSTDNGNVTGWNLSSGTTQAYYWVGNGGDWLDVANHWATSSGGSTMHTVPPTFIDDVYFDANSFTLTGQVVTVPDDGNTTYFRNMNWTGVSNNPTFQVFETETGWVRNRVYGNLILDPNMSLDFFRARFEFLSTGNYIIDTKGLDLSNSTFFGINYTWNANVVGTPGTGNLASDLNAKYINIGGGAFNTNNYDIDAAGQIWLFEDLEKVVNFGTSNLSTGLWIAKTYPAGTSIDLSGSTLHVNRSFEGGGLDYNDVTLSKGELDEVPVINSNTFNNLTFEPGVVISLEGGSTQTVIQLTAEGDDDQLITIKSSEDGNQATISQASGTVNGEWLVLKDNNATGGAIFNAVNATDDGNVTGWNFIDCHPTDAIYLDAFTSTSLDISWEVAPNAEAYDVRYRLDGTTLWTTVQDVVATSYQIMGLETGMPYDVRIRTVCTVDRSILSDWSAVETFTTDGPPACEVPVDIVATALGDFTADLSWTVVASAVSYDVRYRVDNTSLWTTGSTGTNSISLSGLESGMQYDFQVKAICSGTLQSVFSDTENFTTTGTPACDAPVNLAVANIGDDVADVSWDPVAGALEYELRYKVQGSAGWNIINTISTTENLTGLASGMNYLAKVQAICSPDGTLASAFTENLEFMTTGSPACEIPFDIVVSGIGDNVATVDWEFIVGAVEYEVRYRIDGTTAWTLETALDNTYDFTGLYSGMPYEFQLRAVCALDGSIKSNWTAKQYFTTTGVTACEVPANVSAVPNDIITDEVDLSWDAANGATEYEVRFKIQGTSLWDYQTAAVTNLTIAGLVTGMNYQYGVRSVCDPGAPLLSEYSDTQSFMTFGEPACEAPANIQISAITTSGATVTWDPADNEEYYTLKYRVYQATGWTFVDVFSTSYDLTGLVEGTDYQVAIKTVCNPAGTVVSNYSPNVVLTTAGVSVCEQPSGFVLGTVTDNSANIDWPDAGGALEYDVRYRVQGATGWTVLTNSTSDIALSALQPGTSYQFQARTVCSADGSLSSPYTSNEFFTTTGTPACDIPVNVAISAITDNTASVNWDDAGGALSYDVRYKVNGGVGWNYEYPATSNLNLAGLYSGTVYRIQVKSVCSLDNSLVSNNTDVVYFTTTGPVACDIPQNLSSGNEGESSVDLAWNAVTSAVGYEVRFRETGTTPWTVVNVGTNAAPLIGLQPETSYQWKVRTTCSPTNDIRSGFSAKEVFVTLPSGGTIIGDNSGDNERDANLSGDSMDDFNLLVYPNPVVEQATIEFTLEEANRVIINVYDMNGRIMEKVADSPMGEGIHLVGVDMNDWSDGVYLIGIVSGDKKVIQRVAKE